MRANLVTRNVLKIKRYAQRLTQKACMGEGGSYLCAPVSGHHHQAVKFLNVFFIEFHEKIGILRDRKM